MDQIGGAASSRTGWSIKYIKVSDAQNRARELQFGASLSHAVRRHVEMRMIHAHALRVPSNINNAVVFSICTSSVIAPLERNSRETKR
jgi:hypothetical protein